MTDYQKIIEGLVPKLDGESAVRHRSALVSAVNTDGTVDLDFNGTIVADVSVLDGALVAVGLVVQVLVWAGDMLVIGGTGGSTLVKARTRDLSIFTYSAVATRTVTVTVPIPANWNTYDVEVGVTFEAASGSNSIRELQCTPFYNSLSVGGQLWVTRLDLDEGASNHREQIAGTGYFLGETVTGNIPAAVTLDIGSVNSLVTTDNVVLIATAYRTS